MTESSTKATPRPLDYEDDIDQMMADELDEKAEYHYTPKFTQAQMDTLLAERDRLLAIVKMVADTGYGCGRASCFYRKAHDADCPVGVAVTALKEGE